MKEKLITILFRTINKNVINIFFQFLTSKFNRFKRTNFYTYYDLQNYKCHKIEVHFKRLTNFQNLLFGSGIPKYIEKLQSMGMVFFLLKQLTYNLPSQNIIC